jgi:hypothetical protein
LLLRAVETILQPAGITRQQIDRAVAQQHAQVAWQMPLDFREFGRASKFHAVCKRSRIGL